ncbi:Uma2 family endonuclease [Candidatus Sumerlaeota bacterium]|nr:Uma2 family endonuclease [Candidatus Sumerlaeota bacterium]
MVKEVTLEKHKYWTYEEYLKLDDERRYEILEGELITVPSPLTQHQRISRRLFTLIQEFVESEKIGEVFYAPLDVVLAEDIVVQPDIMFISTERKDIITEKNISGAPDLVVEILSPTSGYYDLIRKKKIYAKYGVKEYWIVDPDTRLVEIYENKEGKYVTIYSANEQGEVISRVIPGFKIDIKTIFVK